MRRKSKQKEGLVQNKKEEIEMQYLGNHISVWIIWRNRTQNPLQENVINNSHLLDDKEKFVFNLVQILSLLKSTFFSTDSAKFINTEATDRVELATKLSAFYKH